MAHSGFLNFRKIPDALEDNQTAALVLRASGKNAEDKDVIPVLSKRKPFLFFEGEHGGAEIGKELMARFFGSSPDAIVSFVSGTDQFHTWKRDDFRSALQSGIVKLLGSLNLLIVDDGLHYGLTRLVGAAIQSEEEYRSYTAQNLHTGPRKPAINYLGIVPLSKVANSQRFSAIQDRGDGSDFEVVPKQSGSTENGFDLNRFHSHYVIVDKSYEDLNILRVDVEKQLQSEMASRQVQAIEDGSERDTDTLSAFIPHVVFFFQGGLEELDRIRKYLELQTPIIIMDGCGGMADVVAAGMRSCSEPDQKRLRATLTTRLLRSFPALKTRDELRQEYADKLYQVVRLVAPPAKLCFIADCSRLDTFDGLNVPLLQAIITSAGEKNANSDQLVRNFKLCIACNRPDVASGFLMNSQPWIQIPRKIPYPGMIAALIMPGREAFVDMLLQQRFPLRFLTSHLDLLFLFRKAVGKELFLSLVWDDILGHNQSDPIREEFILMELNLLIYSLTGIKNYLDLHELSRVALMHDETVADPNQADANSLNALIVFAVLLNRAKLVKVLLKYCIDPIPSIVFVEMMYRGIYRSTNNTELRAGLKRQADEFGNMATEILEIGIRESPQRAKTFFQRTIPCYNNKTTLEMAFDARNKTFISHSLVQNWLDQFGNGFIRVKGAHQDIKLVLSAYLIFPMYLWLSFPKVARNGQATRGVSDVEYVYEPRTAEEAHGFLQNLKNSKDQQAIGNMGYKEHFPSLPNMIYAVWNAPIVKFWTWFLIYIFFLIVIGTDMMMPACTNFGLDVAVFILTALIWLELLLRTICDILRHRKVDIYLRATDLIFQTVFNVLFFLYRLAPYREVHPFAGRVILAFGVMYYFYSVWQMFYMFSRQLGPLVRIIVMMFKQDMPKWIVMMLPFFISTSVIWQALITPDYPFTGEDWRRAFYRGTFTIFGAFYYELEYNEGCEKNHLINWNNFTQPASAYPQDRCWLGDYKDYTCNTVSFWSYFFVINYYFFLKLGMMVVLVVFYIFRQTVEMPKANLIWRFYRFDTLFDYHGRSSLPFPLNILGNIYLILTSFSAKKETTIDPELTDLKMDTFIYWKSVAADYFTKKNKEEAARAIPMKQNALLGAVKGGIQSIVSRFGELGKKLVDVDENARNTGHHLQQTTNAILRQGSGMVQDIASAAAPSPHAYSRETPYLGTNNIKRILVPDNKVSWAVFMDHYNPESYSRPREDFSLEEQEFVDPERDWRHSAAEARTSASTRSTDWNSIEYEDEDAVYRKTWLVDEDGEPLIYRLDVNGLPLNPEGRTGLRGRGALCRYGPNHRIILAITTIVNKKMRFIVQMPPGNVATLPNVPLCHYDSEYSVAAVLIDSIFNETDSSEDSDFDPTTIKTEEDLTNIIPNLLRKQWAKEAANVGKAMPAVQVRELYRSYLDTPLNTDNAWMEALVLHVAIPSVRLETNSVHRWKNYSTADSGLLDLDAVIIRSLDV